MQNRKISGRLVLVTLLMLVAGSGPAQQVARFYLEHTISRQVYGPIVNRPGYRFQIGTEGYVVVEAPKGEVCFSTYPNVQYMGPFELEEERIIALGKQAYSIVRLDSVARQDIPAHIPVRQEVIVPPPVTVPQPEAVDSRWSSFETVEQGTTLEVWIEPMSRYKYDWELGGMEGKRGSDIEATRAGVGAGLGGWSIGLGLTLDAEHADSVIPPGLGVSDLRIENGSGLLASLGYQRRLRLDPRWCALLGGALTYRDESYDLVASTLTGIREPEAPDESEDAGEGTGTEEESGEPTRVYETKKSKADLREIVLTLGGGVQYDAGIWGAKFEVLLHAFDDTDVKASLTVMGQNYELKGKRSHPLSVAFGGWYSPLEQLRLEARLSLGAETALRLGAAYEW